jgi:hypothetical protein
MTDVEKQIFQLLVDKSLTFSQAKDSLKNVLDEVKNIEIEYLKQKLSRRI